MKKSLIVIIVIVLLLGGLLIGSYNGMVSKREAVDTAYSNLDVTLQRRADLIPNLVNTVKGYTSHETAAIEQVTNARTKYLNSSSTDEKIEANNPRRVRQGRDRADSSVCRSRDGSCRP